jgi:hypothetical protein
MSVPRVSLVYRLLNLLGFVAFKMGRRSGLGRTVRAGLAVGGRISKAIRNRRATQPPAHFQRNPLGRGQLAVFPSGGRRTRSLRIDLQIPDGLLTCCRCEKKRAGHPGALLELVNFIFV